MRRKAIRGTYPRPVRYPCSPACLSVGGPRRSCRSARGAGCGVTLGPAYRTAELRGMFKRYVASTLAACLAGRRRLVVRALVPESRAGPGRDDAGSVRGQPGPGWAAAGSCLDCVPAPSRGGGSGRAARRRVVPGGRGWASACPGTWRHVENEREAAHAGRQRADGAASRSRRPSTTTPAVTSPAPTRHGSRRGRSASSPQAGDHLTSGRPGRHRAPDQATAFRRASAQVAWVSGTHRFCGSPGVQFPGRPDQGSLPRLAC